MSAALRRCAALARSFLAFDFGTQRVGVATGNSLTRSAHAAHAPSPPRARRASRRSRALIAEWQPDALVVGVPFHPDGARARQYRAARGASRASCTAASACRCTRSTSATPRPRRGRAARADVDAAAAALILEQFLADARMSTPRTLDAEALYAELLAGVRGLLQPDTALVGIWSGGAWLAERLQRDLRPGRRAAA